MSILLSKVIEKSDIVKETPKFINEREFDYFCRATTKVTKNRCIFINKIKYKKYIDDYTTMVITTEEVYGKLKDYPCGFCIANKPRDLYFEIMNEYELSLSEKKEANVFGKNLRIGKFASIADYGVKIGDNAVIEDFARIEPNVEIGDNTVIRTGAKIGEQGFNIFNCNGVRKQMYHGGKVIIGKNTLIGHNAVIEQALYHYGRTIIGEECTLGSNVLVGHNGIIGNGCEITAGSHIAGYATIGDNATLRLGTLVMNGVTIGENAHVGIGSVVLMNVPKDARVFGNPAVEIEM